MKNTVMVVIVFLFLLAACDNEVDENAVNHVTDSSNSPADSKKYTITYSAGGVDVSKFLGWQWVREDSDFTWIFKNDGTISVIHCCGDVYNRQFNYLLCGDVLITYGSEISFDEMEVTVFTMTENENGVSFTRDNGKKFIRGAPDGSSSAPLVLSNDLLGSWQGEDGTEYEFSSDTGLLIDSQQYGYFVRYRELMTIGPLVDGETADLLKYQFNRNGNKLYLKRSWDGKKSTFSLAE